MMSVAASQSLLDEHVSALSSPFLSSNKYFQQIGLLQEVFLKGIPYQSVRLHTPRVSRPACQDAGRRNSP